MNEVTGFVSNQELLEATQIYNFGSSHVHNYTSTVTTPATCKTQGVMTYNCAACGDSYTEAIAVDPAAHGSLDANGDCTLCGKHIKDVEKQAPAQELNFLQRIIQWFRDLLAKLLGR